MSCGCGTDHSDGKSVVNRIREKGISNDKMKVAHNIKCVECGTEFLMETFEAKCPKCSMVYGVTPCSASDKENVRSAEINF